MEIPSEENRQPVNDFSSSYSVEDMFDTMTMGIGLAANQAGVDMNLFIIDIAHRRKGVPRIFINGEITKSYGECWRVVYLYSSCIRSDYTRKNQI